MTVDQAISYLKDKLQAFESLGRVELPALRQTATNLWAYADRVGNLTLGSEARKQFADITKAQQDWEIQHGRVEWARGILATVGVQLGVIPLAAGVAAGLIALALAVAALLAFRDKTGDTLTGLVDREVRAGRMTAQEGAAILERLHRQQNSAVAWPTALVLIAAAAVAMYFLPRPSSRRVGA